MSRPEPSAAAAPAGAPPGLLQVLWLGARLFTGRVLGAVLTYLVQILLMRWLGAETLGVYLHAFALCVLLGNIALLGLGSAAMRFVAQAQAQGRPGAIGGYTQRSRQIVGVFGVLLGASTAGVGYFTAQDGSAAMALVVAGAVLPVYALLRLQAGIGHALSWFAFWNVPNNILRPLAFVLGVVVLHRAGYLHDAGDIMLLHGGIIIAVFLGQSGVFRRGMRRVVGAVELVHETRQWLRTALPLMLVSTFTAFYPEVNLVVAEPFLLKDDLAVFNVAFRTAMFLGLLMLAIDNSLLPRVSKMLARGDRTAVHFLIRRGARAKSVGVLAFALGLGLCGRYLLGWFGDPRCVGGYPLMMLLVAGFVGRAVIGPAGDILSISGHQDRCVAVYGAGLALTVVLDWLLIPRLGAMGAATTVVTVMLGCDLVLHWMARHVLGVRVDLFAPPPEQVST